MAATQRQVQGLDNDEDVTAIVRCLEYLSAVSGLAVRDCLSVLEEVAGPLTAVERARVLAPFGPAAGHADTVH